MRLVLCNLLLVLIIHHGIATERRKRRKIGGLSVFHPNSRSRLRHNRSALADRGGGLLPLPRWGRGGQLWRAAV